LAEHIASAREARAQAERLRLQMPDVTPARLAAVSRSPVTVLPAPAGAVLSPSGDADRTGGSRSAFTTAVRDAAHIAARAHALVAPLASLIFAVRHRSHVHGS
jgi:hypothetical protein